MTIEYVLLAIIGGVLILPALMRAPKTAYEEGGIRLAARIETQMATGSKFVPYPGGSEDGTVPWTRKE